MVKLNSIGRGLGALVVALLLAACGGRNYYTEAGPPTWETSGHPVPEVIRLINAQRVEHGLTPLIVNDNLNAASQFHADYMANKDCYAHLCPGGPGLLERVGKFHFNGGYVGENIAASNPTPKSAAIAWMNSKGHRENILNPDYTHVGAGYTYQPRDGGRIRWVHYWVMDFAVADS